MLICFSLNVTICQTTYGPHTIWLFLKTLYIWATYGLHMGRIWAAHMWPICFGRSSVGDSNPNLVAAGNWFFADAGRSV